MTDVQTWTFDRHPTHPGPWVDECDRAQWVDPATDLDCLVLRNRVGAWCGYVGVPPGHPFHGVGYHECALSQRCGESFCPHSPGYRMDVHGDLTFSSFCHEGAGLDAICHVPLPGREPHVFWLGFDCSHHMDLAPHDARDAAEERYGWSRELVDGRAYRDFGYVRDQCARLAQQLAATR